MTGAIFPIEVIERVIDFVYELRYDADDVDPYAVWKACALTCRAMRPRSQYWLFHTIILSSQSQAESLMHVLRRNPIVARHTRVLIITGPSIGDTGQQSSWISWIPLLLAPRMTNLKHLYLFNDVFAVTHPTFPMALTAFRSVRRLALDSVQFSTFGHCTRLIHAFSHLDYLSLYYLSWKRPPPDSPHPQPPPSTGRRRSPIAHLDFWSDTPGDPELREFTSWLIRVQEPHALRTLGLRVRSHDSVQNVLRCGPFVRSVYLTLEDDSLIDGFENLAHLQSLHIQTLGNTFPLRSVSSIVLSAASQQIQSLTVYIKAEEKSGEDQEDRQQSDDRDSYRSLDDALCIRIPKGSHLTLCLYNATSKEVVPQWRKELLALLPKFCASGRFRIESIRLRWPDRKWYELRDGF